MIPVVFDPSVIVSAIGWRGPAHRCLALVARHRCRLVVTGEVLREYEQRVPGILAVEAAHANVAGPLSWIRDKAWQVVPTPLGKRRSRDANDDCFPQADCSLVEPAATRRPTINPPLETDRALPWHRGGRAGAVLLGRSDERVLNSTASPVPR